MVTNRRPDPATPRRDPPWPGWLIVVSPFAVLLLGAFWAVLRPSTGGGTATLVGLVLAGLIAFWLAAVDQRRQRLAGERSTPSSWALLSACLYLALRTTRQRGAANWTPAVACLVITITSLALTSPIASGVAAQNLPFDRVKVAHELQVGIKGRTGLTVTVECPSHPPFQLGAVFSCAVAGAGESTTVILTIVDDRGNYSWALD
jgi:hypothetical protein